MHSMYAKLFSRIAQSSLMEEDVEVRYCFMMMIALADSAGDIIGTDIAIARMVNLPLETFKKCVAELMEPDPNSNSQEEKGRRVIASRNGRGYHLVNYTTYRAIKTTEEKRAYMREYMRNRRKRTQESNRVSSCKEPLGDVTQGEGELDVQKERECVKTHGPSLSEFCDFYCDKIPDLGDPVPRDSWLMEQHGYLASEVWPSRPPKDWRQMGGKLISNYRSRWNEIKAKRGGNGFKL